MRHYLIVVLLIVMVIAQWAVPASMIIDQEEILNKGVTYKFQTAPVDPSDPFRGSYLTLRFKAGFYRIDSSLTYKGLEKIFVNLKTDESGFAAIKSISRDEPIEGDYVIAQPGYESGDWDLNTHDETNQRVLEIRFPFERFYLEESKARDADREYQEASEDSTQVAYAIIKVHNGKAAIEDVILNGESVRKIVAKENAKY